MLLALEKVLVGRVVDIADAEVDVAGPEAAAAMLIVS